MSRNKIGLTLLVQQGGSCQNGPPGHVLLLLCRDLCHGRGLHDHRRACRRLVHHRLWHRLESHLLVGRLGREISIQGP